MLLSMEQNQVRLRHESNEEDQLTAVPLCTRITFLSGLFQQANGLQNTMLTTDFIFSNRLTDYAAIDTQGLATNTRDLKTSNYIRCSNQ